MLFDGPVYTVTHDKVHIAAYLSSSYLSCKICRGPSANAKHLVLGRLHLICLLHKLSLF